MTVYEIIAKKQAGLPLTAAEIDFFVLGYTHGEIPDYQMAALLMAIYFMGMDDDETYTLVDAMLRSGRRIDTSGISGPKIDKHSTGGVGDKVSLVLAPLVAAAGLNVPMISGRGLGHTGGTLDKLESIPGLRTDLSIDDFLSQVDSIGVAIIAQTEDIVPADRKMYALRDVTATVPSIPLICGSIMSKKLAAGLDGLVLDVKTGRGAFISDTEDSRRLAGKLTAVGHRFGLQTSALITAMDEPLGYAIGNWLEIEEAVRALRGGGPPDLMEVTFTLGSRMLLMAGLADSPEDGEARLKTVLDSRAGFDKLLKMVAAQGADVSVLESPDSYQSALFTATLNGPRSGYVARLDAYTLGLAAVELGAGRRMKNESIDPTAGILLHVKVGDPIEEGEKWATLCASESTRLADGMQKAAGALKVAEQPTAPTSRIVAVLS